MKLLVFLFSLHTVLGYASFHIEGNSIRTLEQMHPWPQINEKIHTITLLKAATNPKEWMLERIEKDFLLNDKKTFSPDAIKDYFTNTLKHKGSLTHLFTIAGNKLTILSSSKNLEDIGSDLRLKAVINAVQLLINTVGIPDCTFLITLHDSVSDNETIPLLTFAKTENTKGILIPTFYALMGYNTLDASCQSIEDVIEKAVNKYPWAKKKEKIFWRGVTTGGTFSLQNWEGFPRSKIVLFSKEHPELMDAKFNHVCQSIGPLKEHLENLGHLVPFEKSLKYKYLIDVDGNTVTYERIYWILLSNSLLLKHESNQVQWFSNILQPGKHYLSINPDFSNLTSQLSWAKAHDKKAKKIALAGRELAKSELSFENNLAYLYLVLHKISTLQNSQSL